jgi:hypothetical protein
MENDAVPPALQPFKPADIAMAMTDLNSSDLQVMGFPPVS